MANVERVDLHSDQTNSKVCHDEDQYCLLSVCLLLFLFLKVFLKLFLIAQLDDDRQALYSHCLDKLRFEYAEELHKFLEAIMPLPQRTIFIDTLNVGLHPTRRNIPYHYGYLFEVLNYYKVCQKTTFFLICMSFFLSFTQYAFFSVVFSLLVLVS